jgi:glycosyltransferase involved in cell wall biosynthesis
MGGPPGHCLYRDALPMSAVTPPLRIGLNLTYLVEDSGGSGTYARCLIPALLRREPGIEITAWIGTTAPGWIAAQPWAGEVRWIRLPVPGIGTPWHLWHELLGIGGDAARRRLDVVHGLANLGPLVHPRVAAVLTILDVIWIHHPSAMDLRARVAMRTLAPLAGHRADRVLAISRAAADDVSSSLHIPRERFDVAPLGISQQPPAPPPALDPVRAELGLGVEPLVLCVAAKRRHKNLAMLVRAVAQVGSAGGPRPQLVLPGSPNEYEDELRALAAELGIAGRVHFPGWISDAQLAALYAMADCFVLGSLQEGFGLPVLEAMRHGVPVACSNTSSLPEVAGDAALLFDPQSPEEIAGAIGRLLTDRALAAELVRRGAERCREFTWERTAQLTLDSYRRAIAGRRG